MDRPRGSVGNVLVSDQMDVQQSFGMITSALLVLLRQSNAPLVEPTKELLLLVGVPADMDQEIDITARPGGMLFRAANQVKRNDSKSSGSSRSAISFTLLILQLEWSDGTR